MLEKDFLINKIHKLLDTSNIKLGYLYQRLPKTSVIIDCAFSTAIEFCNNIIDAVPRYSSADHGTVFKVLNTIIYNCLQSLVNEEVFHPSGYLAPSDRKAIKECFTEEYNKLYLLNLLSPIEKDLIRVSRQDNSYRLSLSETLRRSALTLLSNKA
jgi:hypothetical protein